MSKTHVVLSIAFIIAAVVLGVWWQVYAYHDCKNAGHSTFYCVMKIGRQ